MLSELGDAQLIRMVINGLIDKPEEWNEYTQEDRETARMLVKDQLTQFEDPGIPDVVRERDSEYITKLRKLYDRMVHEAAV